MNRTVLGVLVVLLLIAGAGGAFVWWKISGLKERLVRDLGNAVGAEVQISSLDLDVWHGELHAAGISLVNTRPSAPWDNGEISQATVRFHLSDLLDSSVPVTVEVSSWNVVFHTSAGTSTAAAFSPAPPDSISAPGRGRIQVTQISAHEGTAEIDFSPDRKVTIHGVAFEAGNNGADVWTTQLQATSLDSGSLAAGAISVQLRGEAAKLNFSSLRMQCEQGLVTGDGDVALDGDHEARVSLKAVDVPMTMLVAVEWQMKLTGLVSGDLTYNGNDQGGDAKGQLAVNHGKVNALPWLGKLASLVSLPDITDVELDKETTNFEWKDHALHLTNLDIRKNDVTRISGNVDVDAQSQVDGRLKLGLPSTVTAKWPQLQDKVFPTQIEDYNWADVHVTGTPGNLQEDLTPRLLAVGLGQGTDLLNQAAKKATDLYNSFLGK